MKKIIPDILTLSRLLVVPIVLYLGITKQFLALIILAVFISLTDFFDGKLARKWNVASEFGAKLDAIGDKCLAFAFLIILVSKNHYFIYILLLEMSIALFRIYTYCKNRMVYSFIL